MRISDWSSDVCSSDLQPFGVWARLGRSLALLPIDRAGARKGLIREHGEEGPPSKSGAVPATVSGERDAHPHPSQKGTDAATGPDAKSCEAWEGCASSYDLRARRPAGVWSLLPWSRGWSRYGFFPFERRTCAAVAAWVRGDWCFGVCLSPRVR